MNYTWGEIQIISIEKMFLNNVPIQSSDLPVMRTDKKYKNYLSSMPNIANEGLLRLMKLGKPIIKKYSLDNTIPTLILNRQSKEVHTVVNDDLEILSSEVKSYYFEVNNSCVVEIYMFDGSWTLVDTITHTATTPGEYTVYKDLIANPNGYQVKLVFVGDDYMYNVRNVALYNVSFITADEIINNVNKNKYKLNEIITDFYDVVAIEYDRNYDVKSKYDSDFILEGDNTLIIDASLQGNFIITYKAYPDKITSATTDATVFTLPSEMIALLPLYIASESYKDDDITLATQYRNQFEVALQNMDPIEEPTEFRSKTGWL